MCFERTDLVFSLTPGPCISPSPWRSVYVPSACRIPPSITYAGFMPLSSLPLLSPLEIRVLGVLVEKQLTTPDYYPLSLNALVAGCNQKTSRDPVMNVTDEEAQSALDGLKERKLVTHSWGASRRVV